MQCFIINQTHDLYKKYINEIYQLRHQVFKEKLKWDVKTIDGDKEIDHFDTLDNIYYVIVIQNEKLLGCIRLLPTTNDYMIEKVFPQLLDYIPKDKDLWEGSRFAVSPQYKKTLKNKPNEVGLLLLKGMYEFGVSHNVDIIVATTESIHQFLKIGKLKTKVIGHTLKIDNIKVIAVKIIITNKLYKFIDY